MPRRKAIEESGMEELLRSTFERTASVHETALASSLSSKTVRKYLRQFGYDLHPGRRPGISYPNARRSPVVKYLRENPEPLPRSIAEAARRMNVTKDTLNAYLRRRKERYWKFLDDASPLNQHDFMIVDHRDRRLPLRALASYKIKELYPNGRVLLEGHLPTGNLVLAKFRVSALATYLANIPPDSPEPTSGDSTSP